jgi:hypothetical protein
MQHARVSRDGLFVRADPAPTAPSAPTAAPVPSADPMQGPPGGEPAGAPLCRAVAEPCFWLLAGAGLLILAGWVAAPVYQEYLAAAAENDAARREAARLELRNRQYQELLEAVERDPQFLAGLLRGRLTTPGSRRPAALIVDESPELRLPEPTPEAVRAQELRIPGPRPVRLPVGGPWPAMFSDARRRVLLPAMGVGCLVVAFVFFAPHPRRPST